jgi:ribosomal protein S18 acetylase RimI-like enzyme
MFITPMPREDVPAYLRGFSDWYAQSLSDVRQSTVDEMQAGVAAFLNPQLDAEGVPIGTVVFDIRCEQLDANVGVLWAGGADFGLGPVFFIHDLRIHPPFRRRGFAREALDCVYEIAEAQGGTCGVALSVLATNTVARELYASNGFLPVSEVLIRPFRRPAAETA